MHPVNEWKYLAAGMLLAAPVAASANPPNVVIFMADDLGRGDLSHYSRHIRGAEPLFETPTMDAASRAGMWFTDAHTPTALCSPTRYSVMSGNHTYRSDRPWGVWQKFAETQFTSEDTTLGRVAKTGGYATGFIGKWHLGGDFPARDGSGIFRGHAQSARPEQVDLTRWIGGGPQDVGFDYDFTLPGGIQGPMYIPYENGEWYRLGEGSEIIFLDENTAIHPPDVPTPGPGVGGPGWGDSNWDSREMGKILSAKAVDFIHQHAGETPFLLYYCSPMVHLPHCPPDEFDGVPIAGQTPTLHLDMVLDLDMQLKRIVDALKANDVFDNTLLIITTDNGGLNISHDTGHRTSGNFSGHKNSPLEGGRRGPFIAVWPDRVPAGTINHETIIQEDLLATVAELVGATLEPHQAMDSRSIVPLLTGEGELPRRDAVLGQGGNQFDVIYRYTRPDMNDYKLIIRTNRECTEWTPRALFNLTATIVESPQNNLIDDPAYAQLVQQMLEEYLDIRMSGRRTAPLARR